MKILQKLSLLSVFFIPILASATPVLVGHLNGEQSAALFHRDERVYAISSDSHFATAPVLTLPNGKSYGTKEVSNDWAYGLSLFEVTQSMPLEGVPSFEDFFSPPVVAEEGIIGFSSSQSEFQTIPARLLQLTGKRHTLPWVGTSIEAKAIGKDPSFQGSVFFSGAFGGIVSRQYLKLVPGSSTRVFEWKRTNLDSQSIFYIVIKWEEVSAWVQSILSPTITEVSFSAQGLSSGALQFFLHCPPEPEKPGTGPNPIGGPDGVGIGGEGSWVPPCEVEISKASVISSRWPYEHLKNWYADTVIQTNNGSKLKLQFFTFRENGTSRLSRMPIYSHSEMAKLFKNPSYTPIVSRLKPDESISPDLKALRETSVQLLVKAEAAYAKYPDLSISALLRGLHMLGNVLNSDQWKTATVEDIIRFQDQKGEYYAAWNNMNFAFPTEKPAIVASMEKLLELRKKLE